MPARLELQSATVIDAVVGQPFVVLYRLKNVGDETAKVREGVVHANLQHDDYGKRHVVEPISASYEFFEAFDLAAGETLERCYRSGALQWFLKASMPMRHVFVGRVTYEAGIGALRQVRFLHGLWPGDDRLQNVETEES